MKLTRNINKAKGMTLLELTVVILVLLSLISILFIGARAWKKGSDRSANILNVRNIQQAVRGHANMNGIAEDNGTNTATTAALASSVIFPDYMAQPVPPAASGVAAYTFGSANPAVGTLYVTNADLGAASPEEYFYATSAPYAEW